MTFFVKTYLAPADVKSPHTSVLGGAAGPGDPKSKREAGCGEKYCLNDVNVFYTYFI